MTNGTIATYYDIGCRWLLKNGCRMSERKWLPDLENFCHHVCAADPQTAAVLCRNIIAGIGAPQEDSHVS